MVKNLPMQFQSLGWEDPLEKEVAIHSSILAWEILWLEEPSRPQSVGLQQSGTRFSNNVIYNIRHPKSEIL